MEKEMKEIEAKEETLQQMVVSQNYGEFGDVYT